MDITDLATVFDMPHATIRTRLHRARKALREKMSGSAPPSALDTLETMDAWARKLRAGRK
jgi:5'-3' exonuclease